MTEAISKIKMKDFSINLSAMSEKIKKYRICHELTVEIKFLLTHSHTMTPLAPVGNKPFENTVGKGEIALNEQFLLFPQCFLPVWITFCHFRQI